MGLVVDEPTSVLSQAGAPGLCINSLRDTWRIAFSFLSLRLKFHCIRVAVIAIAFVDWRVLPSGSPVEMCISRRRKSSDMP